MRIKDGITPSSQRSPQEFLAHRLAEGRFQVGLPLQTYSVFAQRQTGRVPPPRRMPLRAAWQGWFRPPAKSLTLKFQNGDKLIHEFKIAPGIGNEDLEFGFQRCASIRHAALSRKGHVNCRIVVCSQACKYVSGSSCLWSNRSVDFIAAQTAVHAMCLPDAASAAPAGCLHHRWPWDGLP